MFSGIVILYIITCILFVLLVLFQGNASNGLSNLTGGSSGSSKTKKITTITRITAFMGLLVFCLTFYIAYDHKKQNSMEGFEHAQIITKEIYNDK